MIATNGVNQHSRSERGCRGCWSLFWTTLPIGHAVLGYAIIFVDYCYHLGEYNSMMFMHPWGGEVCWLVAL
jgi:hypothetical protein